MGEEVVIDRRFRGPPASANGGYTCGLVAAALGTWAAEVNLRVPPPLDVALAADSSFPYYDDHAFPGCFVCGPDREANDGMRIFPGALHDKDRRVAATWTPDESVAGEDGLVRPEFLWAALDCPGYFATEDKAGLALLGRMSAVIHRRVRAGEPLIVTGWPIDSEGRKHRVGSALHDAHGELVAAAQATWITLNEAKAA